MVRVRYGYCSRWPMPWLAGATIFSLLSLSACEHDESSSDESTDTAAAERSAICTISTAALAEVAGLLIRGEGADEMANALGSQFAGGVCELALEQLAAQDAAPFTLETPQGEIEQVVTWESLTQPTPPPQEASSGVLDCFRWDSTLLVELCLDGSLNPPAQ